MRRRDLSARLVEQAQGRRGAGRVPVVCEQQRVQPGKGALRGLREPVGARVVMALLAEKLDEMIHHEQGCFMASMPVCENCTQYDVSANDEAPDVQAVLSLVAHRVRADSGGNEQRGSLLKVQRLQARRQRHVLG